MHKSVTHPYLTLSFLSLLFWLPLPLGSNRDWAWSIMEIWAYSITAVVLYMLLNKRIVISNSLKSAKPVLYLLAIALLWTSIQIIPLPIAVLDIISPNSAQLRSSLPEISFITIALDPNVTAKALLKGLAFFAILLLMLVLIDSKKKVYWFAYTILAAGLFQATYGAYMVLSGVEYSFFFEKEFGRGEATGTFINRNHLAGYLEMVLAIGIGLLISLLSSEKPINWRERLRNLLETLLGPKALIRLSLIIICIALILTKSRMGNAAFFTSLLISGSIFLFIARHATRSTSLFLVSLIVLDILIIGSLFGIDKVVDRIEKTTTVKEQRDDVYRDTLAMLYDFPLTGIGAGNYSIVFPTYQGESSMGNFYHVHNDYLEFAVEYGIFGFFLFGSAVIFCWVASLKAMKRRRSPLYLGMAYASFMGILTILIHSAVDFNLQIPANAAMFTMIMGLTIISLHSEASCPDYS